MRVLEGSLSLTVLGHRVLFKPHLCDFLSDWCLGNTMLIIKQKTTYLCKFKVTEFDIAVSWSHFCVSNLH